MSPYMFGGGTIWGGRTLLAAVALLAVSPTSASAAWLGYKNETTAPIVVQTSVMVNGRVMRGKAHLLYPGEIAWDNIAAPGAREVAIFDPKANNRLVFQDTVNVVNQDVFVAARLVQPPTPPGAKAAPPAQIRLVGVAAPVPGGVVPVRPGAPSSPTPNSPKPNVPVRPPAQPQPQPTPPPPDPPKATPPAGTIPVRPPAAPPPAKTKSGK